jgi:hypothetical protein
VGGPTVASASAAAKRFARARRNHVRCGSQCSSRDRTYASDPLALPWLDCLVPHHWRNIAAMAAVGLFRFNILRWTGNCLTTEATH